MSNPHFLPYQKKWLDDTSDIKIWEKSRRIGATYVQSYEDFLFAIENKRKVYFSSADESAAREYIDYIRKWAKVLNVAAEYYGEVIVDPDKDINALQVRLPDETTISALTSNPKRFRSKGGKAVWDEAAWHDDPKGMWDALEPTTMWGDPLRILSTHNGKRFFYSLIEKVRSGKMPGSIHRTTIKDAVDQGLLTKIFGRQPTEEEKQEWLDARRKRCRDEDQWLQEYMCEAVDEANAFLDYEMLAGVESDSVLWGELPQECGELYLGMDIGRRKDLSVIWLLEKIGPMKFTRKIKELERVAFRTQKEVLYQFLKHPKFRRACIDETGLGMQLAEEAMEDFGKYRVEGITFNNTVKEELAYGFRTSIENKQLIIPSSQDVREDLHSVKKTVTAAGNIRLEADSNAESHGDRFWAGALADHAGNNYEGPVNVDSRKPREADDIMRGF